MTHMIDRGLCVLDEVLALQRLLWFGVELFRPKAWPLVAGAWSEALRATPPGARHTSPFFLQPDGLLLHAQRAYPNDDDPVGVTVLLNRCPGVSSQSRRHPRLSTIEPYRAEEDSFPRP